MPMPQAFRRRQAWTFAKYCSFPLGHLSCDLNGGALPSLMPYLAAAHGFNYQARAP